MFSFLPGSKEAPIKVESLKAKIADIKTTVTATGTVQPINEVEVGTQVSGVVEKIYVDYNTVVKKDNFWLSWIKPICRQLWFRQSFAYKRFKRTKISTKHF